MFSENALDNHAFGADHAAYDQDTHTANGDFTTRNHAVNGKPRPRKGSDRPQGVTRERSSHDADYDGAKINGNRRADSFGDHAPSGRNGTTASRRTTGDSRHGAGDLDDDDSKWIHRDKLAQIESQELQAAGFILPKPRSHSKVRRDNRHHEQAGAHQRPRNGSTSEPSATSQSRSDSVAADQAAAAADPDTPSWDLRLPDEIAEEEHLGFCVASGLSKGGTRIPVAKLSPAPIPVDYLERPTPVSRKSTNDGVSGEVDAISYPKTRPRSASTKQPEGSPAAQAAKRSVTDGSPKKASTANRKLSTSRSASSGQRPKTRSGPNKDSTSRPSTRSGDLAAGSNSSKQPEGNPPWLVNAYRPDPRLPPDQQLLPTVARRLQQEKWEKEGKFGNVLDKEFRPLNDEGFLDPPEKGDEPEPKLASTDELQHNELHVVEEPPRSYTPKSPSVYSTMPKIQDKASPASPPLVPTGPETQQAPARPVRVQEQQEKEKQSGGCGCCVVM